MVETKNYFRRVQVFFEQVRQEASKVSWPSRRETTLTTAVVFVFAMIAAVYFVLVDQVCLKIINFLLGLGM